MFELKIFNWIEENIVKKILTSSPIENFKKWTLIFKEGELSNWKWYVIKEWMVSIIIQWVKVADLGKWEMFWEIGLLRDEQRNATVQAVTDIELISLSLGDLIEMVNHDDNIINKQIMRRIEQNLENNF